jgi:polysaccharide pyruvyl transferase WcaK-like protein
MVIVPPRTAPFRGKLGPGMPFRRRPRVTVWGTSFEKVADAAQLLAIHRILRARCPEAEVVMLPWREHAYPDFRTIPISNVGRVLWTLSRSDALVVVGAPFLETTTQLLTTTGLFAAARSFRCPILVYGVTLFPMHADRYRLAYRTVLSRADLLVVREAEALSELHQLGVSRDARVCTDPRMILEPSPPSEVKGILNAEGIPPDGSFVAVTTRHLHDQMPDWVKRTHDYSPGEVLRSNAAQAEGIAWLGQRAHVVFIPMHPRYEDDQHMARALGKQLPRERWTLLQPGYSPQEVMGIIRQSELLLSGRLGSGLFAAATGTPLVGIAYESRLVTLMNGLDQKQWVHRWKELDRASLLRSVQETYAGRQARRAMLETKAQARRERVWRESAALAPFLPAGSAATAS